MPSAFGQGRDLPVGDCMLEDEGGGRNEDSLCFRILRLKIVRGTLKVPRIINLWGNSTGYSLLEGLCDLFSVRETFQEGREN